VLPHVVVCQGLSACARPLLTGFQDDHFAWFAFYLAFAVVREHALLQSIGCRLDILAPFVFNDRKSAEPDLWVYSNEILKLLLFVGH
jgi:hypothetical protein